MHFSLMLLLGSRGVGRAARLRPRPARRARGSILSEKRKGKTVSGALTHRGGGSGPPRLSLADFHPAIARTWIAAASNKMLQPHHVTPNSKKLAWWMCPSCQHQHNKRIDLHLALGGACPKCGMKPSLGGRSMAREASSLAQSVHSNTGSVERKRKTLTSGGVAAVAETSAVPELRHRCRPNSACDVITAENANRLSKSIADDQYLRRQETRNLLPMLAKSYDKEKAKIGSTEVIRVSPKLDGIRCVVTYRADTKQVLFFSRSGTLFECCDDAIEPALRCLFEKDPSLVLDGELYNDSVNLAQLRKISSSTASTSASSPGSLSSKVASVFYEALRRAAAATQGALVNSKRTPRGGASPATAESPRSEKGQPVVIRFEQLTSAIRTTRQRRTPAIAALQRQLQYHVFDILYSTEFPDGRGSAVPFSFRYATLAKLLAAATKHNTARIPHYNPMVLRMVPNLSCTAKDVDAILQAAMRVGYEGVMIRREGRGSTAHQKTIATVQAAHSKVKLAAAIGAVRGGRGVARDRAAATAGDVDGGYGYGQRSSTLLKYKIMQDAEYVIVGAVEGSGKWKGSLGSFICVTPNKKHRFTVTPASTDAEKQKMWRTWKKLYNGKALTVQFQEITPDGVPRFPVGKSVRGAADGHDWI